MISADCCRRSPGFRVFAIRVDWAPSSRQPDCLLALFRFGGYCTSSNQWSIGMVNGEPKAEII